MRLSNSAPFRNRTTRNYETRRARHSSVLPTLKDGDEAVAQELRLRDIATRRVHLDARAAAAAGQAVDWLRRHHPTDTVGYLPLHLLEDDPALFLWGLAEDNLDIAESHIGLPVRYLGLEVRAERAVPTGSRHPVRHWHFDVEDRRMLKIIVYLTDVDGATGPFEFLSQPASDLARQSLRVRPGLTFLPDAAVSATVPASDWHSVTGPAGTAVYADTARLLHRIKAPTGGDRYSATFVYTSDRPRHTLSRFMPPRHIVRSVLPHLTARQVRALNPAATVGTAPDRKTLREALIDRSPS